MTKSQHCFSMDSKNLCWKQTFDFVTGETFGDSLVVMAGNEERDV